VISGSEEKKTKTAASPTSCTRTPGAHIKVAERRVRTVQESVKETSDAATTLLQTSHPAAELPHTASAHGVARTSARRQGRKVPGLRETWRSAAHRVTAKTAFARPGGVASRRTI